MKQELLLSHLTSSSRGHRRGAIVRYARPLSALMAFVMIINVAWVSLVCIELSVSDTDVLLSPTPSLAPVVREATEKKCATIYESHREERWYREDVCYSQSEVREILTSIVTTLARVFMEHKVTYFLESGTLLGSFREKGVIEMDYDADLGTNAAGFAYLRDNPVEFPPEYDFNVWNSSVHFNAGRDDKLSIRLIHKESALYADVFVFYETRDARTGEVTVGPLPSVCFGACYSCPQVSTSEKHLNLPIEWVYPLVDCPFEGHTLKCPAQTEQYLVHMFGPDFRTPRP